MTEPLLTRLQPPSDIHYPSPHLGLSWTEFQASDLRDAVALVSECESHDEALATLDYEYLADLVEMGMSERGGDVIAGRDNDDNLRALAWVEVTGGSEDIAHAHVNAFVHPAWRGRGIGRAVLKWQDARARQLLVDKFGPDTTVPVRVSNQVDSHMHDRRRLYMAAGFAPVRTFELMRVELTEDVLPNVGESDTIRIVNWNPLREEDVFSLHRQVFAEHWGSNTRTSGWWTSAHTHGERRWTFLALDGNDHVVGYIVTSRHVAHWIRTGRAEAYAELLGVDSSQRGQGIAKRLLAASMRAAYESGVRSMSLDVDYDNAHGARQFYQSLGFESVGHEVYYALDM